MDEMPNPFAVPVPKPKPQFRRFGRFSAPARMVREFHTDLKRVMGQCIVFRAEHMFDSDSIEYWAASEHFRQLPSGALIPCYCWVIAADGCMRAEEVDDWSRPTPRIPRS